MKKILLTLIVCCAISAKAQISNLTELASGSIQVFSPIIELDKKIYGYFMIVKLEDVDKNKEKFEYVLLDKNLNKVANGEFVDTKYKLMSGRFLSPEKSGDKIIITRYFSRQFSQYGMFVSNRILDIKENKISPPFYYDDQKFVEGDRPSNKLMKTLKKLKTFEFPLATGGGFVLVENFKLQKNNNLPQSLKGFNNNKEKIWEYQFSSNEERINKFFNVIDKEHFLFTTDNKTNKNTFTIHSLNPVTGALNFTYDIENNDSEWNHIFSVTPLKDRFVITGKISPYKKTGYELKKASGLFRIELDKNGKELSKKYFLWNQASAFLPMNKKGKTKKGYRLFAKNYFVFNDGTISVLTEKRKEGYDILFGRTKVKTTDFVILNFDKDFNLSDVKTIQKDLSKWSYSDYLYSQKIKEGNGVVFFYNDYKKDPETRKKNWILGIVTLINGKMTHEQIPMSSKEHFISPYIAKEGFILLREYNKDSDYDEIRLERLNY
jgi:hypothetical protein